MSCMHNHSRYLKFTGSLSRCIVIHVYCYPYLLPSGPQYVPRSPFDLCRPRVSTIASRSECYRRWQRAVERCNPPNPSCQWLTCPSEATVPQPALSHSPRSSVAASSHCCPSLSGTAGTVEIIIIIFFFLYHPSNSIIAHGAAQYNCNTSFGSAVNITIKVTQV